MSNFSISPNRSFIRPRGLRHLRFMNNPARVKREGRYTTTADDKEFTRLVDADLEEISHDRHLAAMNLFTQPPAMVYH